MRYLKEEITPDGANYTVRRKSFTKLILFGLRELTDDEERARVRLLLAENEIVGNDYPREIVFTYADADLVLSGICKAVDYASNYTIDNMSADSIGAVGGPLLGLNATIMACRAIPLAKALENQFFPEIPEQV